MCLERAPHVFWKLHIPNSGYAVGWFVALPFMLGASYLFYLLIEKPSHRLARTFDVLGKLPEQKLAESSVTQAELDAAPQTNRG